MAMIASVEIPSWTPGGPRVVRSAQDVVEHRDDAGRVLKVEVVGRPRLHAGHPIRAQRSGRATSGGLYDALSASSNVERH